MFAIILLLTLLISTEQFAAARAPVRALAPLQAVPPSGPTPLDRTSAVLMPGFVHGTKQKNLLAQGLLYSIIRKFSSGITHDVNIINARKQLNDIAEDSEPHKCFHLLVLNDMPLQRAHVFGYGFYSGHHREGLAFQEGNLKNIERHFSADLQRIIIPFTSEGADASESISSHLRGFLAGATKETGVLLPPKRTTPSGQTARGKRRQGGQLRRHQESASALDPVKATHDFLATTVMRAVSAIQKLGYLLHKAELSLNDLERTQGTNFDWRGITWKNRCEPLLRDIDTFWASFGSWAIASLRQHTQVFDAVQDGPINARLQGFSNLSKYWSTRLVLAQTIINTQAWVDFLSPDTPSYYIMGLGVTPIQNQNIFETALAEMQTFVGQLHNGVTMGHTQKSLLSNDEMQLAFGLISQILGSLVFAQTILASSILLEAQLSLLSAPEQENVQDTLALLQDKLYEGFEAVMGACNLQVSLLKGAPYSQNIFRTFKAFLLPFYTIEKTNEFSSFEQAFGRGLTVQNARSTLAPIMDYNHTSFGANIAANILIDEWATWAEKAKRPFREQDLVVQDIRMIQTVNAENRERIRMPDTLDDSQETQQLLAACLSNYADLKSPTVVGDDYDTLVATAMENFKSLIIKEVQRVRDYNALVPSMYLAQLTNFNNNHATIKTAAEARLRVQLLQFLVKNYDRVETALGLGPDSHPQLQGKMLRVLGAIDDGVITDAVVQNHNVESRPVDHARPDFDGDQPLPQQIVNDMTAALAPGSYTHQMSADQRVALYVALAPMLRKELNILDKAARPTPPARPQRRPRAQEADGHMAV